MKKILFLLAILPMILMSCSKDKDKDEENLYNKALIGSWIEDTDDMSEAFCLDIKADRTGSQWMEKSGVPDEIESLTWSATQNEITITVGADSETTEYKIESDKLHLTGRGGTLVYKRNPTL
ncbi:MAG: hypothetical protein ACRCZZ_05110 [Phocaeicola sp.]